MMNLPHNLTKLAEECYGDKAADIKDASKNTKIHDIILADHATRDAVQNAPSAHSQVITHILNANTITARILMADTQHPDKATEQSMNFHEMREMEYHQKLSLLTAAAIITGTQQLLACLNSRPDLLDQAAATAVTFDYSAVAPAALQDMTLTQTTKICNDFLGINEDGEDGEDGPSEWNFVMRHEDSVSANQSPLGAAIDASYYQATNEVIKALANDDFERWFYDDDSPIGSAAATTASQRCRIAIQVWTIRELFAPA